MKMVIPPQLVAYLIYFKDFTSEEQASGELGEFYRGWADGERQEVVDFVSTLSRLSEADCRKAHKTNDPILDAEIVQVKSCSALYGQIDRWLSEARTRFG